MQIAIYSKSSGQILRSVCCPPHSVDIQCADTEEFFLNCPPSATHIRDNTPVTVATPALPSPTEEQMIQQHVQAVQTLLDSTAQQKGYDGILSACSYAASSNSTFQAEGRACLDWRDRVWIKVYEVLDAVASGSSPMPGEAELLAEIPAMIWPEPEKR